MTELKKVTQLSWRRFLLTNEGQEGMLHLRERAPAITKGETSSIIFEAGVAQGYIQALNTLSEIIAQEPPRQENVDNP